MNSFYEVCTPLSRGDYSTRCPYPRGYVPCGSISLPGLDGLPSRRVLRHNQVCETTLRYIVEQILLPNVWSRTQISRLMVDVIAAADAQVSLELLGGIFERIVCTAA